jgi:hypothetical protein
VPKEEETHWVQHPEQKNSGQKKNTPEDHQSRLHSHSERARLVKEHPNSFYAHREINGAGQTQRSAKRSVGRLTVDFSKLGMEKL